MKVNNSVEPSSTGVHIQSPQLDMELRIVPINKLFIHEETIPVALEQLKHEIASQEVIKHPIIVDSNTFVVLDGMHRVAALTSLNYNLVPVCLVDYRNTAIKIFAWYREFNGSTPFSHFLMEVIANQSYTHSEIELGKAIEMVNQRFAFAALSSKNKTYTLKASSLSTIFQIYTEIAQLEVIARKMGYEISYSTEIDALESLKTSSRSILIVPSLTKHEVVSSAMTKQLFPQKTTRHVVPARPLFVNIPLEWLRQSNASLVNDRMREFLDSKRIVRRKPGAVIEGRRYEEFAYIFKDS